MLDVLSINIEPIGAVMTIAKTAMDRIKCPDGIPSARGMVPMAACTVAFGIYENPTKSFSFHVNLVLMSAMNTPHNLNPKAIKINRIP